MNLHDLAHLFIEEGLEMGRVELSVEALVSLARKSNGSKRCCIVREWFYLDVEVSGAQLRLLTERGWKPAVLLALNVVRDERGRVPAGGWVRSGFQTDFSHDCIFETSNTLYLLQGRGFRKRVSLDVLSSLS
ncbi:hypothetical protein [Pseudomonas sp. FP1740]|uniref:DUF6957 family protein n=1 Tax=Pseudomonas sp. FP1740 TaxID=2954078 RepID=UPI002733F625|nr:hypothetical protein [Pseudomonas sp. FP1740]WLG45018.1 hypothetical protein PSH69_29965 [Pseudomonas sp. FP1740]